MLNNFIYAQTKELFLEALGAGNILDEAIVFIEDTKEIWNHGHYFAGDCGFDSNAFSALQTAVAQMQASKLDSSTAESTYAKKTELPSLDGYLTKSAAESLYATISQYNTLNNTVNQLTTAVNNKAEQDGTYPDMTVGTAEMAETLGGRPFINNAEFTFRATADKDNSVTDGMATITKLMGNSVVWNQKARQDLESSSAAGLTATWEGNKIHIQGVVNRDTDVNIYSIVKTPTTIEGHKYLARIGGSELIDFYAYGSIVNSNIYHQAILEATNGAANLTLRPSDGVMSGQTIDVYISFQFSDLTQMFQAGNEPTTIEEYEARKPIVADEYAYNEGEVVHMNATGIKSVGDNAWDEQWEEGYYDVKNGQKMPAGSLFRSVNHFRVLPNNEYYLKGTGIRILYYDANMNYISYAIKSNGIVTTPPNSCYASIFGENQYYSTDIMVTLVHSGWKQDTDAGYQPYWEDVLIIDEHIKTIFPDGMKAAGDAYDVVMNRNGKGHITKNIASIDLGELEWGVDSSGFAYSQSTIPAMVDALGMSRNVICTHLGVKQESYWIATTEDVLMIAENGKVFITGNILTGTSASELKDKLDGVILYYESNTPITYDYDTPFNLSYRIADFGTEEVIASQGSAPLCAKIEYGFNAYDTIVTNKLAISKIKGVTDEYQEFDGVKRFNNGIFVGGCSAIGNEDAPGGQPLANSHFIAFGDYCEEWSESSGPGSDDHIYCGIYESSDDHLTVMASEVDFTCPVNASAFYESSDETLKNFYDDVDVDFDALSKLPKKYFSWKADEDNKLQIGTSAQEVQKVYPEIVNQSNDGTLSVDYTKLSVVALAAVDELYKKNQELEERLAKLESILLNKN